jgi:Tfp pilus assembly protein PilX
MEQNQFCPECGKPYRTRKLAYAIVVIALIVGISMFQIVYFQTQITSLRSDLQIAEGNLQASENKVILANRKAEMFENELSHYKLNRPTLSELKTFLAEDTTNQNKWVEGIYICMNFAADLKEHARNKGYNISYIIINFDYTYNSYSYSAGHTMNGAYLADGTWVWIEPQTDEIIYGNPTNHESLENQIAKFYDVNSVQITEIAIVW